MQENRIFGHCHARAWPAFPKPSLNRRWVWPGGVGGDDTPEPDSAPPADVAVRFEWWGYS